jgi:hypothetical protein
MVDDGTYGSFLVSSGLLSFWGVSKYESASVPFGAWHFSLLPLTQKQTEEGRKRDTKEEEEEEAATTTTTTNIPTPPVTTDGNQPPPQTTQISELKFG